MTAGGLACVERRVAYVHIPFCSAVCPYCDFAVVAGADGLIDRYAGRVDRGDRDVSAVVGPLDSVYFGGGHPESRAADRPRPDPRCARSVVTGWSTAPRSPSRPTRRTSTAERAGELRRARFQPGLLRGAELRRSGAVGAGTSARPGADRGLGGRRPAARRSISVSVDLIFGTPRETDASWDETLRPGDRRRPRSRLLLCPDGGAGHPAQPGGHRRCPSSRPRRPGRPI